MSACRLTRQRPVGAQRVQPRVAVLMSTYNGAQFLPEQLDSLAAQQCVEVALQVRDDGSTDTTCEVLSRYADRWPNLAHVPSGPNLGPAMSFLELLRTAPADADYYAFCDQDDVWLPGKLARAADLLADAAPALYCSNVTCVAEDLTVIGVPREDGDTRFQHLLFENIAYGCTTVMNRAARELVTARMPQRGVIMHDWWCALVVAAFGSVVYDPEPGMILYRQHGRNEIGVTLSALARRVSDVSGLIKNPGSFYRIHAQADEFFRGYGSLLTKDQLTFVRRLVLSRSRMTKRLGYALSGIVTRSSSIDELIVRMLIAANRY